MQQVLGKRTERSDQQQALPHELVEKRTIDHGLR
jgi:hypothetical protein